MKNTTLWLTLPSPGPAADLILFCLHPWLHCQHSVPALTAPAQSSADIPSQLPRQKQTAVTEEYFTFL